MEKSLAEHCRGINEDISVAIDGIAPNVQRIISQQQIKSWCEQCQSLDDLVAIATIASGYADRSSSDGFDKIAEKLSELEIPLLKTRSKGITNVTLISVSMSGSQLKLVLAYASALVCMRGISKVNLIFTGEWQWQQWCKANHKSKLDSLYENFYEQLKSYDGGLLAYLLHRKKLNIQISPKGQNFISLLGDLIIRFEGPAHFKSSFLFNKLLNDYLPVVTATFNSQVTNSSYSFATLIRQKMINIDNSYFYEFPIPLEKLKKNNLYKVDKHKKYLLSAYSLTRIKEAFDKFTQQGIWGDIASFLEESELCWLFVGASDANLARQSIPGEYSYLTHEKIKVMEFCELNSLFRNAFAYIAIPGVFGGGRAASLAISHNVPVLTTINPMSDISNALPLDVQYSSLEDIFSVIKSWRKSSVNREKILFEQQKTHEKRKKIFKKSAELKSILDNIYYDYNYQKS